MLRFAIVVSLLAGDLVGGQITEFLSSPALPLTCHVERVSDGEKVYTGGESDRFCEDYVHGSGLSIAYSQIYVRLDWSELPPHEDFGARSHIADWSVWMDFAITGDSWVQGGEDWYSYHVQLRPFSLAIPIRGRVEGSGYVPPSENLFQESSYCDGFYPNMEWQSQGFYRGLDDQLLGVVRVGFDRVETRPSEVARTCYGVSGRQHWETVSVSTVPEPAGLSSLGLLVIGLALVRRRLRV